MRNKQEVAKSILGNNGRMVGGSKSIYAYDNPKNLTIFNSNLVLEDGEKIWYGDLDLTLDHTVLKQLSKDIGEKLYVLYEMDGRFENESKPKLKNAVAIIDGVNITLKDSDYFYLENEVPYKTTDDEVEAKNPKEKRSPVNYSREDFEDITISLPDFTKFHKKTGSLEQLQQFFINKFGREEAADIYMNLWVTAEDYQTLENMTTEFCKAEYPDLHPVKVEQSVAWYMLDLSPCSFQDTPKWAEQGFGYVKIRETNNDL